MARTKSGRLHFVFSQTDVLGRKFLGVIEYTLNVLLLVYCSVRATALDKSQGIRSVLSVISAQIYFTGFEAMPLISILALATGGTVVLQGFTQLTYIGGTEMIGNLIVVVIMRELVPLMTSLIVIARSGTAVASELGNMRANREIEALQSMGIDPLGYIVFPRIVGGVLSVIALAFYFSVIAILGGYLVSVLVHEWAFSFYIANVAQAINSSDVFVFFLKNLVSGTLIFAVSSYQGLQVKQSPHEVPQVTTAAVMNSIIYVVGFHVTISGLQYAQRLADFGVL